MLDINLEFIDKILFVKLDGNISSDCRGKLDEIVELIKDNCIKEVRFDLSKVNNMDFNGRLHLYDAYCEIKGNNTNIIIIKNINDIIKKELYSSRLFKKIFVTDNRSQSLGLIYV